MTEQQLRDIGSEFSVYLRSFHTHFDPRCQSHLRDYCRGLLSDLPRKSVEPIALAAGCAVRTLQEFIRDFHWDHAAVRNHVQRKVVTHLASIHDNLGTVGVIDETSVRKKGTKTPGIQRQYLGCVGKTDNGVVTVHVAVARGQFKTILDADLFLPESWSTDRDRCRGADIPDTLTHETKWQLALAQVRRAKANGVVFDWLTFDEGYGDKPGFLAGLEADGYSYVGEVPRTLSTIHGKLHELVTTRDEFTKQVWKAVRMRQQTTPGSVWEVKHTSLQLVREGKLTDKKYRVMVARSRVTSEVKYFVSNAECRVNVVRLLRVAFRRWTVEHAFRIAKSETGLMHYEGRSYIGMMRHMVLCMVVGTFAAMTANRLRGGKCTHDDRASAPCVECDLYGSSATTARHECSAAGGDGDSVPSETQRGMYAVEGTQLPHCQTIT